VLVRPLGAAVALDVVHADGDRRRQLRRLGVREGDFAEHVHGDPRLLQDLTQDGLDRILVGLVVRRKSPGEFQPELVDLLRTFATQSVLAIQNARLFREIEDKGRQLALASQHKSQFLANMSHELRTPLNAIIGFSEIMREDCEDAASPDAQRVADLGRINSTGKHLLSLVSDVLDVDSIESDALRVDISQFSLGATLNIALPLVMVALTGQFVPGMAVLRASGPRWSRLATKGKLPARVSRP